MCGDAEFVTTDHASLRGATFLDGREVFWSDRKAAPLALSAVPSTPSAMRVIFHVGFCGSTLLARLLDEPGRTFVLKEPQALADLVSQASLLARQRSPEAVEAVLARLVAELAATAPRGEALVVKPSSWPMRWHR